MTPEHTIKPADAISFHDEKILPPLDTTATTPVPITVKSEVSQDDSTLAFEDHEGHSIDTIKPTDNQSFEQLFAEPEDLDVLPSEEHILSDGQLFHAEPIPQQQAHMQHEHQLQEEPLQEADLRMIEALTSSTIDGLSDLASVNPSNMEGIPTDPALLLSSAEARSFDPKPKSNSRKEKKHPTPLSPSQIPPEYREKPPNSYSSLIEISLRSYATERGMSLSEIYSAIQALFPYYQYAAYGWQNSVRHNLSLNKSFVKIAKEGKGWLWGLDEELCREREAKKNRPLVKERKEQERREKRERDKREKEEKDRKAKQEKEALDREKKEREKTEKERREKEMTEKKKALAVIAQVAAAKGSTSGFSGLTTGAPFRLPSTIGAGTKLKGKPLGVSSGVSKPQVSKPPINKETLKALQLLQQTISAQLSANTKTASPAPDTAVAQTSSALPAHPTKSSASVFPLGNSGESFGSVRPSVSPSPVPNTQTASSTSALMAAALSAARNKAGNTPLNKPGTQQQNAKAAAIAKALVMTLAQSMSKPGATNLGAAPSSENGTSETAEAAGSHTATTSSVN